MDGALAARSRRYFSGHGDAQRPLPQADHANAARTARAVGVQRSGAGGVPGIRAGPHQAAGTLHLPVDGTGTTRCLQPNAQERNAGEDVVAATAWRGERLAVVFLTLACCPKQATRTAGVEFCPLQEG